MLDILEVIHDSGIVFNDLKPDNILIGFGRDIPDSASTIGHNIFQDIGLHIIDFGLASKWRSSKTG